MLKPKFNIKTSNSNKIKRTEFKIEMLLVILNYIISFFKLQNE